MAFPTSSAPSATNISTAATTHVVNIGSPSAGQLLLAIGRVPGAAGLPAADFPTGWSVLKDVGQAGTSNDRIAVAYKYLTAGAAEIGQATMNVAVDPTARLGAWLVWKINGAADPAVTAPQISTDATGASATPDPTSVTPAGGTAKDYLAFWLGGWEGEQTSPPASNPTNYALYVGGADTGTAGAVALNARVAGAAREINSGAAIDPPSWTISASDDWIAWTVLIHPTPPATVVSAPAAIFAATSLFPAVEIVPRLLLDLKAQQFLMFGPAGLRKMPFEHGTVAPGAPVGPQDATVVSPAATVNAPGVAPVPQVRVEPAAALALHTPPAPVPQVRVSPAAATILAPGASPIPQIRVMPGAATILAPGVIPVPEVRVLAGAAIVVASASGTVSIIMSRTVSAPAAIILAPGVNPTPRVTILPAAATMLAPGVAPVPQVRVLPSAATVLASGSTPVPQVTVSPAAATLLATSAATPEVRVLPGAALVVGTASGSVSAGADRTVSAPAAIVNAPGVAPTVEVRVLPGAALVVTIATGIIGRPGYFAADLKAQQLLLFGPGGRLKQRPRPEQGLPAQDRTVVVGAATISIPGVAPVPQVTILPAAATLLAPGVNPTVEIRVLPGAALVIGTASGTVSSSASRTVVSPAATIFAPGVNPVPEVRVLPAPAAASYLATGIPEVRISPAAALILASATGTPELRILPGSATVSYLPGQPTVEIRVLPGAALIVTTATGSRLFEGYYQADLKIQRFLLFGPGRRFKAKPHFPPFRGLDRTVLPAAATITSAGATPSVEIRIVPGAALVVALGGQPSPQVGVTPGAATFTAASPTPVPNVRVLPGAATVIGTASGVVSIAGFTTVVAPAAVVLAPGVPPVPRVTILPAAALIATAGALPTPKVVVSPAAATLLATGTGTPAITIAVPFAPVVVRQGGFGAAATKVEIRVLPGAATIVVTGTGTVAIVGPPGQVSAPAARIAVRSDPVFVFAAVIEELTGELIVSTLTGEVLYSTLTGDVETETLTGDLIIVGEGSGEPPL